MTYCIFDDGCDSIAAGKKGERVAEMGDASSMYTLGQYQVCLLRKLTSVKLF